MSTSQNSTIIPLKVGFFGEQGTGKTTSAALLAAALSKEVHSGAPVWVTDPELGWQFPKRRIFHPEGVELVQRTVPTFKAMMQDMRDAERNGACVWAVELSKIWMELLRTVQGRCGDRWGAELVKMWGDYVNLFLNSPMHCFALGRVGDITEDVYNERNEIKRVKVAEGMKAGGQRNNFGYEPHLVLRMSLEKKPRRIKGEEVEGEGRMVHRADVLKDRTWELNGKTIRWSDKAGYKAGGYGQVWSSIAPHFREMQAVMGGVTLDTLANSDDLINDDGQSEYWEKRRRCDAQLAEVQASFDLLWGGQGAAEKRIRLLVGERIFGVRTKEAREQLELREIERGLRILRAIEDRVTSGEGMPTTEMGIMTLVEAGVADVDHPGAKKTITEILLEKSIAQVRSRAV